MYNQEFQKQQALRLLNTHLGRKPTTRTFINDDPNAAAILEMQGARIHKGRNYDVTVLPPELVNDEYFNEYTLPYMMPGKEITQFPEVVNEMKIQEFFRQTREREMLERQQWEIRNGRQSPPQYTNFNL